MSSVCGSTSGTSGWQCWPETPSPWCCKRSVRSPLSESQLIGIWLIAKDWPDLTRSTRDTTAWRLGLHRKPLRLRPSRQLDDVPVVAALAVAVVAVVDLVSAVTPNVSWRGHVLVHVEPVAVMRTAHALAVPVSVALLVTAYYLYRRRSHAFRLALALMAALTVFDLVKGLDFEEAALTAAAAALLWASRSSFYVRHAPTTLRSAVWRLPLLLAGVVLVSIAAVAFAAPATASATEILRATGDLLLWQPAPFTFHDELARTGLAVELTGLLALLAAAYIVFRPLAAPRDLPDPELRRAAAELVREHGADTLSFFKLRADKQYLFNAGEDGVRRLPDRGRRLDDLRGSGRRARGRGDAASHRSCNSPESARSGLPRWASAASARTLFEQAGLRALYMGDEAIVDTERFSLEGRPIRKVRQSVSRLRKAGYRTAIAELGSLDDQRRRAARADRERLAARRTRAWLQHGHGLAPQSAGREDARRLRDRRPRRDPRLPPFRADLRARRCLALVHAPAARDAERPHRVHDRRGDRAPSRARCRRGVAQLRRVRPAHPRTARVPRADARPRFSSLGDTWFQIERLYRFNAKFFPRWEPRYFMYERRFGLPRAGIAALWLEGQLPKPKIRRRHQAAGA